MEQQNELNRQLGETLQQIKEHQENILAGQQEEGEESENQVPQDENSPVENAPANEEQNAENADVNNEEPKDNGENN